MAILETTRLNANIRGDIKRNALLHRFSPDYARIVADKAALADRLYQLIFDEAALKILSTIPDGWLETQCSIGFKIGYYNDSIYFSGAFTKRDHERYSIFKMPSNIYRRLPNKYEIKLSPEHELAKESTRITKREEEFHKEFRATILPLEAILKSANNVRTLRIVWPEVEPFLPKTEEAVRKITPNLPAVSIPSLNAMLRLPATAAELPEGKVISMGAK